MAEWEHTQNTRQRAGQGLPEPFALARIRVQRCRPRRFGQTFTGSSPQHPREKRLQPLSRAPIACARRVGAPCIVSDLQKLQQSSKSNDFRKRQYPCRRYRRVPLTAIHLSPWRAESETVLGLSWVAVVGMLWYVGWTLLYANFGGLLTQVISDPSVWYRYSMDCTQIRA